MSGKRKNATDKSNVKASRKPSPAGKRASVRTVGTGGHSGIAQELRDAIAKAEAGGVSRYRIAKAAGLAQTAVHRCADGVTMPRIDVAERIAKAAGYRLTLLANKLA